MGVTSVRLHPENETSLETLSKQMGRSRNYLINLAISEFAARHALAENQWTQTVDALGSVKSGAVTDERDVMDWLESWGSDYQKTPPST